MKMLSFMSGQASRNQHNQDYLRGLDTLAGKEMSKPTAGL